MIHPSPSQFQVIILQRNLARDPQALNSSGKARTRLVVAVNYGFGENQKVDYIDVTVFGTTAENTVKFLSKGAEVLVEGHLSQNIYDPGNGESKIYNLEVIGDRVQFGRKAAAPAQAPAEVAA